MSEQNHKVNWNADVMIEHAKALQHVVKELEKNRPKPSDVWGKSNKGTEGRLLLKGTFLAVPNLLSLATEIALKAWQCQERQKAPEHTHDLLDLFHRMAGIGRPLCAWHKTRTMGRA